MPSQPCLRSTMLVSVALRLVALAIAGIPRARAAGPWPEAGVGTIPGSSRQAGRGLRWLGRLAAHPGVYRVSRVASKRWRDRPTGSAGPHHTCHLPRLASLTACHALPSRRCPSRSGQLRRKQVCSRKEREDMARRAFVLQCYRTKRVHHLHTKINLAAKIHTHLIAVQQRYYRRFTGYSIDRFFRPPNWVISVTLSMTPSRCVTAYGRVPIA